MTADQLSGSDERISSGASGVEDIQAREGDVQTLLGRMLRANLTAEAASARLFAGQSAIRPASDDVRLFKVGCASYIR